MITINRNDYNELQRLHAAFRDGKLPNKDDIDIELKFFKQKNRNVQTAISFVGLMHKCGLKREAKKMLRNAIDNAEEIEYKLPLYDRTADRGK